MAKCEHCNAEGCAYPDHGNGPTLGACKHCIAAYGGDVTDGHAAAERAALKLGFEEGLRRGGIETKRLRHQRAVLRREVRRLNAKVAALTAVVAAWRSANGWDAVRAMAAKPIIDGPLWELRKALGLTACEVSNEDVIRAAARKLGKGGEP